MLTGILFPPLSAQDLEEIKTCEQCSRKTPQKYTKQEKAKAIAAVIQHKKPVAEVAQEFGILNGTLVAWVCKARQACGKPSIRNRYTPEFKQNLVQQITSGNKTSAQVTQQYNISKSVLNSWIKPKTPKNANNSNGKRKNYDEEFKRKAVERVKNGETVIAVSADLGIPSGADSALQDWVLQDKKKSPN